jgi:hypothetical protein
MRLAIMQPYFFPYIGYFQLINAVDTFVIYDDVNYINRGWINRNNLLCQGSAKKITLETEGASQNKLINEIGVGKNRNKLLKMIAHCYSKASLYEVVYPLIEEILLQDEEVLSKFLAKGLRVICEYLGLDPTWVVSSDLYKDNNLRGQDKIIAICDELGAKQYVNLPGGRSLYDNKKFEEKGVKLLFIEPGDVEYRQSSTNFIPNLSIIDVLMFNDQRQCKLMLQDYRLV